MSNLEINLVASGHVFLGWENGWGGEVINGIYHQNDPEMVKKCIDEGHAIPEQQITASGSENIRWCPQCRWYSKYDSSG